MKPIYGRWSGIATMWCVVIAFDLAGGIFDLVTMDTIWWLCFWQLALVIFAAWRLRHELRLLKAGREREQLLITRHDALMVEIERRLREVS